MNKSHSLWYIDETIEKIRNTGGDKRFFIGDLRNHLSEINNILNNIPVVNKVRDDTIDVLQDMELLFSQKSLKNNSILEYLETMGTILAEQTISLSSLRDLCYPVDLYTFLQHYLEKGAGRISMIETDVEATLKDYYTSIKREDLVNDELLKEMIEVHTEVREFWKRLLKRFYQDRDEGKLFEVKNQAQAKFLDYFGKQGLVFQENAYMGFVEFFSQIVLALENKDVSQLDRAREIAHMADLNITRSNILRDKFNQLGEDGKEKIESPLNTDYSTIKEPSLKDELEKVDRKAEIIGLLPFFNVLSGEQIERISSKIRLKRYEGQAVLFNEGDGADELYIIKSGEIEIYKSSKGIIKKIATLMKGDMFGEMGIILASPRSLSARISSDKAELYVISKNDFLYILKNYSELSLNFARILCRRIDDATRRLIEYLSDYYSYFKDKLLSRKKNEILGMTPLFKVLTEEQIERLSSKIRMRRHERNSLLFNEGDRAEDVYIIKSGEVTIYKVLDEADVRDFVTLMKGDIFGEMGIISDTPRSLSARVSSDRAELYVISRNDFLYMMKIYPELSLNLTEILCRRIDDRTRRYLGEE